MRKIYIPEITPKLINKNLSSLKKKFKYENKNKKLILTKNGIFYIGDNSHNLTFCNTKHDIIENYIDKYNLIIVNEKWMKNNYISQIPLNCSEINITYDEIMIGNNTRLKLIIEKNKDNNKIVDIYFLLNDKEIGELFKNDMGYFLKMLM